MAAIIHDFWQFQRRSDGGYTLRMRWTPALLIRVIGLLLCASSIVITVLDPIGIPSSRPDTLLAALLPFLPRLWTRVSSLATSLFIALMLWRSTSEEFKVELPRSVLGLLALQTLLTLLLVPELQFVVAVQIGFLLAPRWGSTWVVAQALITWMSSILFPELMAWVIPAEASPVRRSSIIALFMLVSLLYNLLAFALGWFAATERRQGAAMQLTNRTLERMNQKLQEAQRAASNAARLNERLAIARELHDVVGHQLTALSVNLQVASHLSEDEAREPVLQAYDLTRQLLSDVRSVVSSIREPVSMEFVAGVEALALRIGRPAIHLNLASLPDDADRRLSHELLRCTQEIITNTVRHADAANMWIQGEIRNGNYELSARDDGKGAGAIDPGNGLLGIQERVRSIRGEVRIHSGPRDGFQVFIQVPLGAGVE